MSTGPQGDRPTQKPGASAGLWSELRRTAPETRAVLAGLLVVLGAWIGPGLQRDASAAADTPAASIEPIGVAQTAGADAYSAAVRTAAATEEPAEPLASDQD